MCNDSREGRVPEQGIEKPLGMERGVPVQEGRGEGAVLNRRKDRRVHDLRVHEIASERSRCSSGRCMGLEEPERPSKAHRRVAFAVFEQDYSTSDQTCERTAYPPTSDVATLQDLNRRQKSSGPVPQGNVASQVQSISSNARGKRGVPHASRMCHTWTGSWTSDPLSAE